MFMIGIDPHKGSHTAVAVDRNEMVIDTLRVDADWASPLFVEASSMRRRDARAEEVRPRVS